MHKITDIIPNQQMQNNKTNTNADNQDLISSTIQKYDKKQVNTPVDNTSIDIKTSGNIYKLIRLNDEQYHLLAKNKLSIFEDHRQIMAMSSDNKLIYSSFSKMYVTLKERFGASGKYYDNWKGAFSFPFLIDFQKGEQQFSYIMNLHNSRSSIEFRIAKLIHADEEKFKRDIMYSPFEEFPRSEINYLVNYLVGFLSGYFEYVEQHYDDSFFKAVQSNLILFGYQNGLYFDDEYPSEKSFLAALQALKTAEVSHSHA